MKKAKIMLTAITVFAVVGGALAFKAKTFSSSNIFCSKQQNVCVTPTTAQTTERLPIFSTTQPCSNLADFSYYTSAPSGECVVNQGTVYITDL
jgi:uncharacterized protein YxeA